MFTLFKQWLLTIFIQSVKYYTVFACINQYAILWWYLNCKYFFTGDRNALRNYILLTFMLILLTVGEIKSLCFLWKFSNFSQMNNFTFYGQNESLNKVKNDFYIPSKYFSVKMKALEIFLNPSFLNCIGAF